MTERDTCGTAGSAGSPAVVRVSKPVLWAALASSAVLALAQAVHGALTFSSLDGMPLHGSVLERNASVLVATTLSAVVGIALGLRLLFSAAIRNGRQVQARQVLAITVVAICVAQGLYATDTLASLAGLPVQRSKHLVDAATAALVALLCATELLILLRFVLASRLESPGVQPEAARSVPVLARTAIFGFLLAWALPLSFLPLHARSLSPGVFQGSTDFLIALPISAEMSCALLTTLVAGALTDRKGWHLPTLAGLLVSMAAAALSAAATTMPLFVLARAVVGLGYGLTWMGIQGLLVREGSPRSRTADMAQLFAGIFTGHIVGAAVGGTLAEATGTRAVLLVSAGAMLLPLVFTLTALRRFMVNRDPARRRVAQHSRLELPRLLVRREFGALLAGSVVPFSIAQVGLLYYAVPLYLDAQDLGTANIGQVLTLYGLSVIYLGPIFGRRIDRAADKRVFIALGGALGGAALGLVHLHGSVGAVIASVVLLGMASSIGGAAQSSYALGLRDVQTFGPGVAMSVLRAADKLGQMLGPLLVGGLVASQGLPLGLALTGLLYLLATGVFLAATAKARVVTASDTAPAGAGPAE